MKLNMHTSHASAFISSTFLDLHEERGCVASVLQNRGLNVNALDVKPASNDTSKKEIIAGIKESDFIILIIGDRYGSVSRKFTGSNAQSITWWEYKIAIGFRKPVLCYFKHQAGSDPRCRDDPSDPLYKIKRMKFEQFKLLVTEKHNPAYFSSLHELSEKVDKSLISVYRNGVVALTKRNSELSRRVEQLENENRKYRNNFASGISPNNSPLGDLLGGPSANPFLDFLKRKP